MNPGTHNGPCDQTRSDLDAYLSGELRDAPRLDVDRHVAACPQCAAELEARVRVRRALQEAVRSTSVPIGLDAKVRRTLRSPAARRPRTGLWAVAAAAVVILGIALASRFRVQNNPIDAILQQSTGRLAAVLNVGLRDHLQCAVFRKYSKQPDPARQMAADLGPAFAQLAPLVQAKLPPDYRIIQGHHCEAAGRQFTHLIIANGDKIVSILLTRKRPGEALLGGIHQAGVDRFQVVGFESHDYLVYVISDLDAQRNLQLAADLAPALRSFLAG